MIDDLELGERLKRGVQVTLVLGAGVSKSRGLPLWPDLLRGAWRTVIKEDLYATEAKRLKAARDACRAAGLPQEFIERLAIERHPLEYQFGFECVFDRLRWSGTRKDLERTLFNWRTPRNASRPASNEDLAAEAFAALLRKLLYEGQPKQPKLDSRKTDTLSLVARAVHGSALALDGRRHVAQVITFNVDDVLETVVNSRSRRQFPLAYPITRSCEAGCLADRKSVAIYHVHGFVPRNPSRYPFYSHDGGMVKNARIPVESLVFTDEQYWQTIGNPGSYASRVFMQALNGPCIFIGLSMTDINVLRLLAQHSIEVSQGFRRMMSDWNDGDEVEFSAVEELSRHYWIVESPADDLRESEACATGVEVLAEILKKRGVHRIKIPSWTSAEFHRWWTRRFLS